METLNEKRRKLDITDPVEFNRAVSLIMDKITSIETTAAELSAILVIQNDLLKATLMRIQEARAVNDK